MSLKGLLETISLKDFTFISPEDVTSTKSSELSIVPIFDVSTYDQKKNEFLAYNRYIINQSIFQSVPGQMNDHTYFEVINEFGKQRSITIQWCINNNIKFVAKN